MATILIIDDDAEMRATMKDIISGAGHTVVTAATGKQGGRLFSTQPIDLVITDIYMPEGEGLELIMELRKGSPDMKIIAISGRFGPMNMLPVAEKLGVSKTLAKPFTPQELLDAIAQLVAAN